MVSFSTSLLRLWDKVTSNDSYQLALFYVNCCTECLLLYSMRFCELDATFEFIVSAAKETFSNFDCYV